MDNKKYGLIILLFLLSCHVIGILFFCKGFLLKRIVVPDYSQCTHPPPSALGNPLPSCTDYPRTYRRVLWLLIDALRYDFMDYDDSLNSVPIYRNKMVYVRDLLYTRPANAKLFRFVADPPTTTMQRLKALTTGGLPTFIDIGSNFNSYEILEDSLIYQSHSNSRNITFIGDDTWLGLYPNMLTKVFEYPSLNVKDIHTVDNGVIHHLFPELQQRDADLIVGHFLGVDHIGHTYGPSHWTMGDKLVQMDEVLKEVIESIDNETLVVVLGDHGMTSAGDHGGETQLETDAALLVYSKLPIFDPLQPSGRAVQQIDLVPTLSLLLGVPIPFSNLGMIIPELFIPYSQSSSTTHHEDGYSGKVTRDLLTALRINANQVRTYLSTYTKYSGDFPQQVYDSLNKRIDHILTVHNTQNVDGMTQADLTELANSYVHYLKDVKQLCRQIWAKFDDVYIWYGLALTLVATLLTPVIILNPNKALSSLRKPLHYIVLISFVLTIVTSWDMPFMWITATFVYWSLLLGTLSVLWGLKNTLYITMMSALRHRPPLMVVLTVTITTLYAVSLLSNSFVLYEGDMVAFFLQTMLVCFMIARLRQVVATPTHTLLVTVVKATLPYIALMVCVRLSKSFYSCRDLQFQDGCMELTFINDLLTVTDTLGWLAKWRLLLSCVTVVMTPVLISWVVGGSSMSKLLNVFSFYLFRIGLPFSSVCVSCYWALQLLPPATFNGLSYWEHVMLPWIVYSLSLLSILTVAWRPLNSKSMNAGHRHLNGEHIVGIVVVVLVTSVWIPLSLLVNDGLALSATLTAIQIAVAVSINPGSETGSSTMNVCVFWGLLTSHTFFALGHSTTVTSLRFECAFTGIHGEINSFNLPLAGALVGLNTLGSQIIFGLGLPLLLLNQRSKVDLSVRCLKLSLIVVSFHSMKLLLSMFAASLHRRHLMVWWVFTPRFLYEAAFQLTTDISVTLCVLLVQKVEGVIEKVVEQTYNHSR